MSSLGAIPVLALSMVACARGSPSSSSATVAAPAAAASPDEAEPGAPGGDEPAPGFRACTRDDDCVAVQRVGCCHNGWKAAVNASRASAYLSSFRCPELHPMCAMYLVRDARVARCSEQTHLCKMVAWTPDRPDAR